MNDSPFAPADVTFARLSDFFLAEVRKGSAPPIEEFARTFPHLADDIRSNFPTLLTLERTLGERQAPLPAAEPQADLLGGCRLEEEIGRGAMGVVYRARQDELDRTVAVKVIALDSAAGGVIDRFELERRAMARLDHPHIVPVYSYGHTERCAFLVMKYIDGKSLDRLLLENADYRSQALLSELRGDWANFARLAANVAAGLQHTHELGLVHRDIKPANLMLDTQGKVWITDFGLAKIFDVGRSLSRTGDAIGTPRYMAPEQLRGVCDARSDVYSLGVTLYELAGGGRAWGEHSVQSMTAGRASLELPDLHALSPDVPEALAKIIMKACEFAPEQRYQSCAELGVVLDRFLAGAPQGDRRKRNRDSDEAFRKKRRLLNYVTIAVGVGAFAIGTASFAYVRNKPKVAAPVAEERKASAANFLERLADADRKDVVQVVHDYVKESIDESGTEFRLADNEKKEIAQQVDVVMSDFNKSHRAGMPIEQQQAEMQKFVDGYRQSTIPLATKFLSVVRWIDRSGLRANEKQAGFGTVRLFATLIINRKISEPVARQYIEAFSGGKPVSEAEFNAMQIKDDYLRKWLGAAQRQIAATPGVTAHEKLNLAEEVLRAKSIFKQPPNAAAPAPGKTP